MIEMWFAFSIVWSIGGALSDAGRVRLDAYIKDQMVGDIVHAPFPGSPSCYDHCVDPHKRDWVAWDDKVNNAWRRPIGMPFYKVLVPTNDTIR
jgi:dynein heavy chain